MLKPSTRKGKKLMVRVGKKWIHFGQRGASDYTIHKDPRRKERYIKRHQKGERWDDPRTAGFWSRWLLWNKPTLQASLRDVERRFGIKTLVI